jgi:hypothetical protein
MHGWHPAFASTALLSGENNTPGSVRRLTIEDGPVLDEELLAYDRQTMRLRYKIIGENALPLTDCESTLQVTPLGANGCFAVWRGSFVAKPDADPNPVTREIAGLYRMGLDPPQAAGRKGAVRAAAGLPRAPACRRMRAA